jgi:hypothetical protein
MVFDRLEREMVDHIDGPSPNWYSLCPGDTRYMMYPENFTGE